MLLAARKLQGIGLVLFVLMFAMTLYPVSLRVAATRSELAQVEYDLMKTQLNIRYLETEFSARASLRQLERWNAESLGYAAPEAAQFLSGERALAELDSLRPVGTASANRVLLAVATVPPPAQAQPKSAAQIILEASIPSARAKEPALPQVADKKPAPAAKLSGGQSSDKAATPGALKKPKVETKPATKTADKSQRLAMLDKQLLTPSALSAIDDAARAEAGAGRGQ